MNQWLGEKWWQEIESSDRWNINTSYGDAVCHLDSLAGIYMWFSTGQLIVHWWLQLKIKSQHHRRKEVEVANFWIFILETEAVTTLECVERNTVVWHVVVCSLELSASVVTHSGGGVFICSDPLQRLIDNNCFEEGSKAPHLSEDI